MFAFLRGTVARKTPKSIELDVNGVGYEVFVPVPVYAKLVTHGEAILLTHCHIREDAFQIFGFLHEEDKALFKSLLDITGVGPKVALSVVSNFGVDAFRRAVLDSNLDAFKKVPGVGRKMAQRIVLEMQAKLGQDPELDAVLGAPHHAASPDTDDVIAALCALGCTLTEARGAAEAARAKLAPETPDEEVVRAALQTLVRTR
jgi:holliday junction DNA helicase RuvA